MSISIDGVKGYEYQYKVTLLIALISSADKINLYVEIKGSEDALLVIENRGVKQNIEIQVKRENNVIDIPKIINWLSHFQERKSDNNLLQKIITNNCTALFITHSRCSDSTVKFRTSLQNLINQNSISISTEFFKEFKKALKNQKFGKTTLMKERESFCNQQSDIFKTKAELISTLKNCQILEEFTDEKVDNHIVSILNSKFNIAQSRVNIVYLELLEIVKIGRNTGNDIFLNIMDSINSNKIGTPIIDTNYKTRLEEPNLIKRIEEKGILLLTGTSQCGKTELAKTISNHFVNLGYDYQIHDNISELKRFLNSNTSDNKIVILEDPLGHISLKENNLSILRALKELLSNKEKHHYLIVSSRIEILFDQFNTKNIFDCSIKNNDWLDLTIKNNKTVNFFWKIISQEQFIPEEIRSTVSNGILKTKGDSLLQIGQLNYLANEEVERLTNKKFSDLEHIARRDSKEIAENLKNSKNLSADILSYISICSNTIHKLLLSDLSYILSNSEEDVSITNKKVFISNFKDKKSLVLPKYPTNISLNQDSLNALNYLEERGFIYIDNDSLILTHPNYYEAGRYLFFERGFLKQKEKLNVYRRCISCLTTLTAFHASKNFLFVYNEIRSDLKNEIFDIAFLGLNSIFPSVEDNSIIFLMNFITELNKEKYRELVYKIQQGGTSSSYIHWQNNTPFISNENGLSKLFDKIDLTIIKKVEEQLSKNTLPNKHDAWIYLETLKKEDNISFKKLHLLLQFDEAFIREKVIYEIFKRPYTLNKSSINELFNDDHPTVIFSAIRASLLNWFYFSNEIKEAILKLACISINKKQVAIRAFNLISTYSTDYGHESILKREFNDSQKEELWKVWGELYPICMETVPLGVVINPARFGSTMDDSLNFLDLETGVNVLQSWYKRIDYQIRNNKVLDEYEMSIADSLMKLTQNNYRIRKNIFSELVNYKDTSFLLSNLKWIIEYWESLHKSEKEQIIKLIYSKRVDLRWIKAVILNSYSTPPKELTKAILGINKLNVENINEVYMVFPKQLLRDCLNVYSGFPQPFWWLAVHHHNREFWNKIIRLILKNENNTGFDICLQKFLRDGVGGFGHEWNDWEEIWLELCTNANNKQFLTKTLLYNTAACTCNLTYANRLWSILINSYNLLERENELIEYMVQYFELFQQTGHKDDIFKIFEEKFILKILKKLPLDNFIFNLLESSISEQEENLKEFVTLSQKNNVRFFGTFNYINNLKKKDKVSEKLIDILDSLPNLIDITGKSELDNWSSIEEYKLDNWIGVN
ncbi:hypothetical protein [Aquimarina algiphila]|uniref:nSTAND3 domain-containing NTPase n=1 Tax=Aquimarina algiphila TaxID=2047982 RepID=UPI00232CBAC6|nr:hypothetical protein [Aquimarina algiphila]